MPKSVEECVRKIKGTNKRTGKPYTREEKWAICTAMHKKKTESSSELTQDELIELENELQNSMSNCIQKLLKNGKAKTYSDACNLYDALFAKAGFDMDILQVLIDKE